MNKDSLNGKPDVENGTIFEFLSGEKPFNGVWFGDDYKAKGLKPYWWRTELRKALGARCEIPVKLASDVCPCYPKGTPQGLKCDAKEWKKIADDHLAELLVLRNQKREIGNQP